MTTSSPTRDAHLAPNHHAGFPPFAGLGGLLAALTFSIGRTADADLAIHLTGTDRGDDVVDVGCGPGVAARRTARVGASSVVGVDPAPVMLRVARALGALRHTPNVRYLAGSAEALPVPDGSGSVLWSLATVHHWHDLTAGLEEARRVLRPGGRFLVIERQVEPGAHRLASQIRKLLDNPVWCAELARFGRKAVVERFSLERALALQLEIYREVAAPAPAYRLREAVNSARLSLLLEYVNHDPFAKRRKRRRDMQMLEAASVGAWPPQHAL